MYQVPIGDFWTCNEVSQANDFFLVERNGQLYHEEILFPCQVQFSVSAGTSTTLFMSAIPDLLGNTPSIVAPDGTVTPLTSTGTSYTFTQNGTYTLSGDFTNFKFTGSDGTVDASLTDGAVWNGVFGNVPNFGEELFSNINELSGLPTGLALSSLDRTFTNTSPSGDMSVIDVSAATTAKETFLNSDIDPADDITGWDVSNVTDMGRMFEGASVFNVDISAWDVSNVTNMARMFQGATVFNADINAWDTSAVTEMQSMLAGAATFNQDLGTWNVGSVTNMNAMFDGASSFNQNIGDWDVEDSVDMTSMFNGASQFDQDLTEWCVRTIPTEPTDFSTGAPLLLVNKPVWGTCPIDANGDVILNSGTLRIRGTIPVAGQILHPTGTVTNIGPGNWTYTTTQPGRHTLPMADMEWLSFNQNTSTDFDFDPSFYTGNLTNMSNMFNNARIFDGDVSNWDTSRVTNAYNMFRNARQFNQDLSGWDVGNVSNAAHMFDRAEEFNQDLNTWDTGGMTDFSNMFREALVFNGDISTWDVTSVNNTHNMFKNADVFNGDLSGWDVSGVENMSKMFQNAGLFNRDLSAWDITGASNISYMFDNAVNFNSPVFGDVTSVVSMMGLFQNARAFNQDITGWDVRNAQTMRSMFNMAVAFNQELGSWVPNNARLSRSNMTDMFRNATAMQGDLSDWCVGQVSSEPTNFALSAGFESTPALLPDWGTCVITDPTGLIINNFNGDRLFIRLTYVSGGTQDIIQPDGTTLSASSNSFVELTQLGQYELPMGVVTQMMFSGSTSTNSPAHDVDYTFESGFYTSSLNYMLRTFNNSRSFNGDVTGWDVSGVTAMIGVFENCLVFNQDLSAWDTTIVTNFYEMFHNAQAFNTDISSWNTATCNNMGFMFMSATAFNQNLSTWSTGDVRQMTSMFRRASSFNQSLNPWDVSCVTNMANMFNQATVMEGNISNWCVPNISSEPRGFDNNAAFEGDTSLLPTWGVCSSFNGIYVREFVGGVGDFVIAGVAADNTVEVVQPDGTVTSISSGSFANTYTQTGWYEIRNIGSLTGLRFFDNDLLVDDTSETAKFYFSDTFNTSSFNEFRQMFREAEQFDGDVSMFDTSNATNMAGMFRNASQFIGDISHFTTDNVDNMANMFRGASQFNQDISGWDVYSVTDMGNFLRDAANFSKDLSPWCVPLIASEPNNFDDGAKFEGNTALQPGWGSCPNSIVITTPQTVFNNTPANDPALFGDVLGTTDATFTPSSGEVIATRWESSDDGGTTWVEIDSPNINDKEYTADGFAKGQIVRTVQTIDAPNVPPVEVISSNTYEVEDSQPPAVNILSSPTTNAYISNLMENTWDRNSTLTSAHLVGTDGLHYFYPRGFESTQGFSIGRTDPDPATLLILDPNTGLITNRTLDISNWTYGDGQIRTWFNSGTILPDGRHVLAPGNGNQWLVYDYTTDTQTLIQDPTDEVSRVYGGAIYSPDTGKVYGMPHRDDYITEVDIAAGTVRKTSYGFVTDANTYNGPSKRGPNGRIYTFPGKINTMSEYDPVTDTYRTLTSPLPSSELWIAQAIISSTLQVAYSSVSNSIYTAPGAYDSIIKLDFNNLDANGTPAISRVTQTLSTQHTGASTQVNVRWGGVTELANGVLMFIPSSGRTSSGSGGSSFTVPIMYLDPSNGDAITSQDNPFYETLSETNTANQIFRNAHLTADGKVVMGLKFDSSGNATDFYQWPIFNTFMTPASYDPLDTMWNHTNF